MQLNKITDVFNFENSSFIAYKNSGDETGIQIPYTINDENSFELLFDVGTNVCLEFNTELSKLFAESGTELKLKISTDKIKNTETLSDDEMMMFRAQIVSYFLKEMDGIFVKEEAKEKEDEKCLCPDCDIHEDSFYLNLTDRKKINAFNIDVWGNINGTSINQNRNCLLKVALEYAKIDLNMKRDNSITAKEKVKTKKL